MKFLMFMRDTGMRKIASGLYMFTSLCLLLAYLKLPADAFVDVCRWLILAMFGGNALEHFFDKKDEKKEKETPSAS